MTAQPISREAARELAKRAGLIVLNPNDFETVNTLACALWPWVGKDVDDALSAAREALLALKEIDDEPLSCQNCGSEDAVTVTVCQGCAFLIKGES